jgi:hypothetical protein
MLFVLISNDHISISAAAVEDILERVVVAYLVEDKFAIFRRLLGLIGLYNKECGILAVDAPDFHFGRNKRVKASEGIGTCREDGKTSLELKRDGSLNGIGNLSLRNTGSAGENETEIKDCTNCFLIEQQLSSL